MEVNRNKTVGSAHNISLTLEVLERRTLLSIGPWQTFFGRMQSSGSDDVGNSIRDAETLALDELGQGAVESVIDHGRDQDMFAVTAIGSGIMQVDMTASNSELDAYLYIYDSNGRRIARDDDGGDGTDARIVINAEAGNTYYIRADAYRRSVGEYNLVIDAPAENEIYTDDFGDDFDDATVIAIGLEGSASVVGQIGQRGDQDMFVYTAGGDGTAVIDMRADGSGLDSYIYVYNSDFRRIARNDDGGDGVDAQASFEVAAGEQYYIRADSWRVSIGDYVLELTGPGSGVIEEEPPADPGDGDDEEVEEVVEEVVGDGVVNRWAVLVGSWDYPGQINDLPELVADVEMMYEALVGNYGFSTDSVHIITGGEDDISSAIINQEFAWLQEKSDGDDIVLFYYTGHGSSGNREYINDNEALDLPNGDLYTESELAGQLQGFNEGVGRIVILDACYSGGFVELANTVANTCVMTSSAYHQISWGRVEEWLPAGAAGSVFTSWLVEGMLSVGDYSVDVDRDGFVSMAEAFSFADLNVNAVTFGWNRQDPEMISCLDNLLVR